MVAATSYLAVTCTPSLKPVVKPLVGDKMPLQCLVDSFRAAAGLDHNRLKQLAKFQNGNQPFTHFRSIRGRIVSCVILARSLCNITYLLFGLFVDCNVIIIIIIQTLSGSMS